jgi:hypothetical protein
MVDHILRAGGGTYSDAIRAMPLPEPAQAQADELAHVRELLAVIHGDGGHHTAAVSLTRSAEDAAAIVHGLRARLAAAETALHVYAGLVDMSGEDWVDVTDSLDEWVRAGMNTAALPGFARESQPRGKTDDH